MHLLTFALVALSLRAAAAEEAVKVFILAGQSNMEGKAKNKLYDHQATDPKTAELFAHLRDGNQWAVRDDVFIKFLDRHGPLTLGYGSRERTGAELEFGWKMGEHFDEPVLLIKAAWGGHSLWKLFRPPSSGMPDDEFFQEELAKAQERVKKDNEKHNRNNPLPTMADIKEPYGKSYRNMMAEVKEVQQNCGELFPQLKGKQLQIAGFVWFQGWNDMYGPGPDEYEANMKNLINDVRRDLNAPNMPFVIAAMGQHGSKEVSGNMAKVKAAQFAMNDVPEFKGNVRTFDTAPLIDKAAEELYPRWRDNFEEWEKTGSDFGYHYMGSAIWFNRIGKAMGDAMIELLGNEG
jgi:alpha-galactosidase